MARLNARRNIFPSPFKKQAKSTRLQRRSPALKIANDEKGAWSPDFSSLTRLRRGRTRANDFARPGTIRTRAKFARQQRRIGRRGVHFSERPVLSRKNRLRGRICAARSEEHTSELQSPM